MTEGRYKQPLLLAHPLGAPNLKAVTISLHALLLAHPEGVTLAFLVLTCPFPSGV